MWRAGPRSCGSLAQGPIEALSLRSAFLQRLAAQLDGCEFGDGQLHRVAHAIVRELLTEPRDRSARNVESARVRGFNVGP
jgi:hypothetical protein